LKDLSEQLQIGGYARLLPVQSSRAGPQQVRQLAVAAPTALVEHSGGGSRHVGRARLVLLQGHQQSEPRFLQRTGRDALSEQVQHVRAAGIDPRYAKGEEVVRVEG